MFKRLGATLERLAADNPVLLAFIVFLTATVIVIPASLHYYIDETDAFLMNVMAEAHGTVFDLLIIGWFLLWVNKLAERRVRNNRYREEIDDYLGWKSPEATHRIAGNIRRLNRSGVRERMRLTEAYLFGANLGGAQLKEADLWGANLEGANLRGATLEGVNLRGANLTGANLQDAELKGTDFLGANLTGALLPEGNDLFSAFEKTKTLFGAEFPPEVGEKLQEAYPRLFQMAHQFNGTSVSAS